MTKLPDSIFDLSFEPRAYEYDTNLRGIGWVPATVTAKSQAVIRGTEITITAHEPTGDVQHCIGAQAVRQLLRPRVEKRKFQRWIRIQPNGFSYSVAVGPDDAREWTHESGVSIILIEREYEVGCDERPTFEEPKADEPREFKVGDRVRHKHSEKRGEIIRIRDDGFADVRWSHNQMVLASLLHNLTPIEENENE